MRFFTWRGRAAALAIDHFLLRQQKNLCVFWFRDGRETGFFLLSIESTYYVYSAFLSEVCRCVVSVCVVVETFFFQFC